MLRISGATRAADDRCWCVPHRVLNPILDAARVFFHFGVAGLTAVTVFRVLVLVENFLQSHILVV